MGEGSVQWLVHINARLTWNEQWKSMAMISNPWPLPVKPSKKEEGFGLGLRNVHDIIILNIKGSHCAI